MSDSPKPAPGLWQTYGQVFASRRIAAMLLLGFSSGLPLALTAGALQAWLTVNGIDLHTIGYFALVGLPYTFKFVWAPLLDRFEPRLLGRRRGWILVFQLAMALACLGLAQLDPAHHIHLIAVLSVVVAWLSASQDVVFDAYRADLLSPEALPSRCWGTGWPCWSRGAAASSWPIPGWAGRAPIASWASCCCC